MGRKDIEKRRSRLCRHGEGERRKKEQAGKCRRKKERENEGVKRNRKNENEVERKKHPFRITSSMIL